MAEQMHDFIRRRLAAGDPNCRVLYKYQSFRDYTCDSLRGQKIKLSTHAELNDAFDLAQRLPCRPGPTYGEIRKFRDLVKPLAGLGFEPSGEPADAVRRVSRGGLRPLEELAMLAAQVGMEPLVSPLRRIEATDKWCGEVLFAAGVLLEWMVQRAAIFCMTTDPASHLMWGYYGDGLRGLCVGYGCLLGNPRLTDPVIYAGRVRRIDAVDAAMRPWDACQDLLYTKPSAWKHEAEWRSLIGFGDGVNRVIGSPFPVVRLILGARMDAAHRSAVLDAVGGLGIELYEARPAFERSWYRVSLRRFDLLGSS